MFQRLLSLTLLPLLLAIGNGAPATAADPHLELAPRSEGEHPLQPLLRFAQQGLERIDRDIRDYECVLIKRERIGEELTSYHSMRLKVRHQQEDPGGQRTPFGVFARFLGPANVEGREVLYVDGERDGHLLARRGGIRLPNLTLELAPTSRLAMMDNRYPITDIGIRNLVVRLIEAMQLQKEIDGCEVRYFRDAKIDDRPCRHVQVKYTERNADARFHMARVFIDEELALPVYYAAYDWPETAGDPPVLQEEYVYTKIRLNPGFGEEDFSSNHPDYHFQQSRSDREAGELARAE